MMRGNNDSKMLFHSLVASASCRELVKTAEILISEVCRETQEPVLLKTAQVELDAQLGVGSHAMKTRSKTRGL